MQKLVPSVLRALMPPALILLSPLTGCCGTCTPQPYSAAAGVTQPRAVSSACGNFDPAGDAITLSPSGEYAGGTDFYLTVALVSPPAPNPDSKYQNAIVCWSGFSRPTSHTAGSAAWRAHIASADIASPGTAQVWLHDAQAGRSSAPRAFVIATPVASGPASKSQAARPAPAILVFGTLGDVFTGLQSVISSLQSLISGATTDVITAGQSLEQSAHAVLQDFDSRYKARLSETVVALNAEDKAFVQNTIDLISRMQAAANAVVVNSAQNATLALNRADIVAYATTQGLPCQNHDSRLVCVTSNDPTAPLTLDLNTAGSIPQLILLGNWLNLTDPEVMLHGQPCTPQGDPTKNCLLISLNEQQAVIQFPPIEPFMPPKGGRPTDVAVSIQTTSCSPQKPFGTTKLTSGVVASTTIHVVPLQSYQVSTVIRPTGKVKGDPFWGLASGNRHEAGCEDKFPFSDYYPIPDGFELVATDPAIVSVSTANCASGIYRVQANGTSEVLIIGQCGGCGKDWFGLNCKGTGWIQYTALFQVQAVIRQALAEFSQLDTATPGTSIAIKYPPASLPPDPVAAELQCHFDTRVVDAGGVTTTLSDDNPQSNKINAKQDPMTCNVSVTFPP